MYYIDGNNVEGSMPGMKPGTPEAEQALVRKISAWVTKTRKSVTIVFDGVVPNPPSQGHLRILHPNEHEKIADNTIIRLLEADQHKREATVVTTDADLRGRALALGARVVRSAEFLDQLPHEPPEVKPTIHGEADVEGWLHYFGLPADGDKPKPAGPVVRNRPKPR